MSLIGEFGSTVKERNLSEVQAGVRYIGSSAKSSGERRSLQSPTRDRRRKPRSRLTGAGSNFLRTDNKVAVDSLPCDPWVFCAHHAFHAAPKGVIVGWDSRVSVYVPLQISELQKTSANHIGYLLLITQPFASLLLIRRLLQCSACTSRTPMPYTRPQKTCPGVRAAFFADRSERSRPSDTNGGHRLFRRIPGEAPGVPPSVAPAVPRALYSAVYASKYKKRHALARSTLPLSISCPQTSNLPTLDLRTWTNSIP